MPQGWLDQLAQDARFGARTFRRQPGFAAVIILTLALATGATTSIFSIVHSVLLRPLPFAEPDRLVEVFGRVWGDDRGRVAPDPLTGPVGSRELEAYAQHAGALDGLAGYALTTAHLDGPDGVDRLNAVRAGRTLFSLLGVEAIAGRTFETGDPLDVAVISASLWRRRFDGDPSLPGRTITLDGRPFTILGVAPEAFQFPYAAASIMPGALPEARTDIWIPLESPFRGRVSVVARLGPGVTLDAATAELRLIAQRIEEQIAVPGARVDVRLAPLADVVVGPARRSLWLLFAATGLVMAAACANVATLLLIRVTRRTREVVTRAALGAGRFRLVRQFLAESLLLALAGGLVGAAIARAGTTVLVASGAAKIPRAHEVALDWQTFLFLLVSLVMVAVLFGLAPALAAGRADARAALNEGGGRTTAGRGQARMRDGLVVMEVAFAFMLACAAVLVIREVARLRNVDTGIDATNVLTLHLTPRAAAQDYQAIEQRVAGIAGVRAAGFTQLLPLQNWGWDADFTIPGADPATRPTAGLRYVTPGYFDALGIPIIRGRSFTANDDTDSRPVILINKALARRYFPDEDPVGVQTDRGTIIGVAGDVRQVGPGLPAAPELYYPAAQNVTMASDIGMTLIVRTSGPPEPLTGQLRATVREVNPNLAVFNVRTMERVLSDALWEPRLQQWLIGLFAALTLVLATIGLYGVTAYGVHSRVGEFAVRMALGSDRVRLAVLVVTRGMRLAAAGLAIGTLAAFAIGRALQNASTGLRADATTYLGVTVGLLAIALVACVIPATRVAGMDPARALRHD